MSNEVSFVWVAHIQNFYFLDLLNNWFFLESWANWARENFAGFFEQVFGGRFWGRFLGRFFGPVFWAGFLRGPHVIFKKSMLGPHAL